MPGCAVNNLIYALANECAITLVKLDDIECACVKVRALHVVLHCILSCPSYFYL